MNSTTDTIQGQTWQKWLAEMRANSTMSVERRGVDGIQGWSKQVDLVTGLSVIRRDAGGFHQAIGIWITTKAREVFQWGQLILEELGGGGYVVMAMDKDRQHFILAAREEPGNSPFKKHMLLGAALQTSIANAEKVHGGDRPPRWEWYAESSVEDQPQDGGRYLDKVNHVGYVIIDDIDSVERNANERIFTRAELAEAIHAGECNSHLAEVAGHLFVDPL